MKFIAIILSIYLTGLTLIPCNDVAIDNSNTSQDTYVSSDHGTDNHTQDLCSPFCTCQCCHIEIISSQPIDFVFSKIEETRKMPSYFENISRDHIHSLLQPPQFNS
ncbi:DUF6660 family protein [uncultured Lacinutrix sp.]|uniref:DUF6660 family protein n=1 Tax=uncultured Lacinutrix sp. TaxID=574032 RepID=UPI00262E4328|nr:DUF6660 family protein [uncultured Lacinutrix sp.]